MLESKDAVLYSTALDTINRALDRCRDQFPFRQILAAAENLLVGRSLEVGVHDGDSNQPRDAFTLQFGEGRFTIVSIDAASPTPDLKLSRVYLEDIANNSNEYIANPGKMQWEWLKDALGVTGSDEDESK